MQKIPNANPNILLESNDFELIEVIKHADMKNFIRREITGNQGWGLLGKMYQGMGLLLFGFALIKAFASVWSSGDWAMIQWMGWGLLFCFTGLIVIHELLHYFAYLLVGARKLSFGMKLRKFMFYVQADKQILNYNRFKVVALAPVVVVAVVSIAGAIIYFEQELYYFFLTILAIHSLFCIGDLGMLCFFENRNDDEILTFDVKDEGKTYFYRKLEVRSTETEVINGFN